MALGLILLSCIKKEAEIQTNTADGLSIDILTIGIFSMLS